MWAAAQASDKRRDVLLAGAEVPYDHDRNVLICKHTLGPGFAGFDNELFYAPNTSMLFGDAKAMVTEINAALKG